MEIRKASALDALVLSRMNLHVQQMHAEAYPDLFKMPQSDDFAVPFFTSMMHDPEVHIFIAEESELPMGYIVLRIVKREEHAFMRSRRQVYIDQIGVQPEHQGKGVGTALMAHAEKLAQEEGMDFVALDSWDFNKEAHQFFFSRGYQTYKLQMWKKVGD